MIDRELRKKVLDLEFTVARMAQIIDDIGVAITMTRGYGITCGKCGISLHHGVGYSCGQVDCLNGLGPKGGE